MILEKALNLFFPIKCGVCGKIGLPICKKCEKKLKQYEINLIFKENIKAESLEDSFENKELNIKNNILNNSTNSNLKIQKIFIYKYQDIIRNLLINYKFNDASYLANSFAYLIKNNKKIYSILKSYDIIIPVPLHKKRMNERGYNQTELIAKKLEIPIETKCLIKTKNIKPQSTKTAKQRQIDIKNVFAIQNVDKIKNKKILLLDDIYTTGSTANECIKTLRKATNKIGFLAIAKDIY